jgi:DNA-directed RNA polymerase subunit M/transcription elongation factor TFIIS
MNPLLKNAVVSIQLGLEDFALDDERRIVSAARNLYSGVLLLSKEVLRRLSTPGSNDILIRTKKKAVRAADGTVNLVGDGKKTIDRFEIEETFKQLQLAVDLSNLKRLADIRNDIEHMHPNHAPALIQEAIADAMPIIRDVIVKELKEEPSALLGNEAWNALLNEAQVFKEEQAACRASFDGMDWETDTLGGAFQDFQCPKCSSTLVRNDNANAMKPDELVLVCSKCGEPADLDEVIETALKESLRAEGHIAAMEGGDPVLDECPECSKETYVLAEGKCLNPGCEFNLDGHECAVCGESLTLDDYRYGDGHLCSYHAHVMSKDD